MVDHAVPRGGNELARIHNASQAAATRGEGRNIYPKWKILQGMVVMLHNQHSKSKAENNSCRAEQQRTLFAPRTPSELQIQFRKEKRKASKTPPFS
jgi:hypothetical protein